MRTTGVTIGVKVELGDGASICTCGACVYEKNDLHTGLDMAPLSSTATIAKVWKSVALRNCDTAESGVVARKKMISSFLFVGCHTGCPFGYLSEVSTESGRGASTEMRKWSTRPSGS